MRRQERWSSWLRPDRAIPLLSFDDTAAMSGIFVDSQGGAARVEMTRGGPYWVDHPTRAINWLLVANHLTIPS